MKNYEYHSNFSSHIKGLIDTKRALGYIYQECARILHTFDLFCIEYFSLETKLTQNIVMKWSQKRETENNKYMLNRVSVIRELAKYMNSIGVSAYLMPIDLTKKSSRLVPHIYSFSELKKLFHAVDSCEYNRLCPTKHLDVSVIFRVIYCCGLRPIEARRLKIVDIDFITGAVKINESKGHKDRLVVLSEDLLHICKKYNDCVNRIYPDRDYFFTSSRTKGMYSKSWINQTFRKFIQQTGIATDDKKTPRLYDLRHTFATHCISKWIHEGKDINSYLPYLSEYMGHKLFSDTAYYIHFVPELFSHITDLNNSHFNEMIPEV